MNRFRGKGPLVLKTYGKCSRKVEAWLSPDIRKIAFASTSSSDLSIGELVGQSNLRKRKKTLSTACSRPVRAAKKKALTGLRESDSEEENVFNYRPEHSHGATRKRRKTVSAKALPNSTSESEDEPVARSRAAQRNSRGAGEGLKAGSSVAVPSYLSRFVTDRRRGATKMPEGSLQNRRGKNPRLSVGDGSWDSSEDFVKGVPRAKFQRKVCRPARRQVARVENTSSELVSPVPHLRRARSILQAVSLNSTSDRPPGTGYKKPLLSSTPSVSSRLGCRHREPSVSEISCSIDDLDEASKSSVEATRSLVSPGRRQPKVRLRRGAGAEGRVREPRPASGRVGRPLSAGQGSGSLPQHSEELFSHVRNGLETEEDLSFQFVSAETHLDSLVASLRERGRAVVVLEKTDLSERPRDGRDSRDEDAFSSCLDSESALRGSGSRDRLGAGSEARGEAGSGVSGLGAVGLGPDAGPGRGDGERRGAGVGSGGRRESASVVWVSSSPPPGSPSDGGHLGETGCGSFGAGGAPRPGADSGDSVSFGELSKDLFLEGSVVEPEGRIEEAATAAVSCEKVLLSPQEAAVDPRPAPPGSAAVCLKKSCRSLQPVVVLEPLDLSKYFQDRGRPAKPGPDSGEELERAARRSESVRRGSPARGDSRERASASSPEGPRAESVPLQDEGRPSDRLRRRLSSAFQSATSPGASPGFALSPRGKKCPSRARDRPAPPKDRPGTGRKACISGLSVSRWAKNDPRRHRGKKHSSQSQPPRAGDCSLFHLQPGPDSRKHVDVGSSLFQGSSAVFPRTPLSSDTLNISSLLAHFSPEALTTHTWSRLKAALSVHKKKKAVFTPKKLNLSHLQGDGSLDQSGHFLGTPHSTPLSRHLKTSLLRSTTATPVSPSLFAEDITDAEKLYLECQQDGPVSFQQCIPAHRMQLCKKVGEGTFGEVFTTTNDRNETVALKIVPIEGQQKVNGEDQKTFGEILHEVIISKELSSLGAKEMNKTNGFIGLNNLHCVRGSYPPLLLKAWDKFDKQRRSENDRPDFFEEDQLFLILEFEFGGSDLEAMSGKLSSLAVAKSILHQVTAALAVAEQALCFEHRDLHWGNILVNSTKEKTATYVLNGTSHSMETKGIHVNIIDYSLSRLEIDGLTVSCDISADEELFMGQGDYQFDIYREMRQENNNSWGEFNPHTNVLWLHYLSDKLLHMSYRNRAQTKPMRELKRSITEFHRELLAYKSAASVLEGCSLFHKT